MHSCAACRVHAQHPNAAGQRFARRVLRLLRRVARTQAKNFYYSFLLLSRPQRQAMCAIYAFMRYCDDLSDAEGISDRAGAIARWQADLDSALAGSAPGNIRCGRRSPMRSRATAFRTNTSAT